MNGDPAAVATYGGPGAWAAAELDGALLQSAGIRSVVGGDAHLHAPLFGRHQVVLLVDADQCSDAVGLLAGGGPSTPERRLLDPGRSH